MRVSAHAMVGVGRMLVAGALVAGGFVAGGLVAGGLSGCDMPERAPPAVDASPLAMANARLDAGPVIGSVTQTGARIWVHVAGIESVPGGSFAMRLIVEDPTATDQRASDAIATIDSGGSAIFRVEGLRPGTNYNYRIIAARDEAPLAASRLRTQPTRAPETRIAFGSCADIDADTARTWKAIENEHPDALVLLGDTPYIDTTGLAVQRERYLRFAQAAGFASLVSKTPLYSVWDDHDFGANNTDGRLAGKSNSRRAFLENRPNPSYGEGAAGIFTSFRHGEVEVFLLDTRWFAGTEPSKGDPTKPTLLGEPQWRWLESGLSKSKAAFKVVACGMVWNGLVTPDKSDCWGRYPHEFERFVRVLDATKATGVVLVSGDVHRSRVIRHTTAPLLGYDLMEFVTSPLHGRVIAELDVRETATPADDTKDTALKNAGIAASVAFDQGEPNAFLLLDAETAAAGQGTLFARFVNAKGERFHTVQLPLDSLRRPR
jgi:alkaline phosphatase D